MGITRAEIILKNEGDVTNVRRGIIKEPEIRQAAITAVVDTGAISLVINEDIRKQLGLELENMSYSATLADGTKHNYALTESVQVHWKNRMTVCKAIVVPHANNVLLGVIPLEAMDLMVNPANQELTGAHGDEPVFILY